MSDRSESYKYTNRMPNPPTRDASRFKPQVTSTELEEMKKMNEEIKHQNELLKQEVARLYEILPKIVINQNEAQQPKDQQPKSKK